MKLLLTTLLATLCICAVTVADPVPGPRLGAVKDIATEGGCGTVLSPAERALQIALVEAGVYDDVPVPEASIYVPITFHVVRQGDGTGGATEEQLCQAIDDANAFYNDVGVQFYVQGPLLYIDSDAFYFDIDSDAEIDAMLLIGPVPNTVNVYCTEVLYIGAQSLCGRGSFTTSSPQGVAMANGCLGVSWNPSTFPHELGHYLNLLHTHAGGDECADGSNCDSAGDLLCDTPADPNLSQKVDENCVYFGTDLDPCDDDPYNPDTSNLMSYSRKLCRTTWSGGQQSKSLATLLVLRPELVNAGIPLADDCNQNEISDFCEADCNENGVPDECDLADGTSPDCNENDIPDECDVDPADPDGNGLVSEDCQPNGIPDECDLDVTDPDGDGMVSPDCQPNGIPDECDIANGTSEDCQPNGIPDECELADGTSLDCNMNSIPDECDIADGTSLDCQPNSIPDECEIWMGSTAPGGPFFCETSCNPDCNYNGVPDECDIADGTSEDCNDNGIPDECDVDAQLWSIDRNSATLHLVDPGTGATIRSLTLTGTGAIGGEGLALDPFSNTLWAVLPTGGGCGAQELGTIDLITGAVTIVGILPDCVNGLAFSDDGLLWGTTADGANDPEALYEISTTDASMSLVGDLGNGGPGEAIAWHPRDDLLYHASGFGPANWAFGEIWEAVEPFLWEVTPRILDGYEEEIGLRALTYHASSRGFLAATRAGELVHRTTSGDQSFVGVMDHDSMGLAFLKRASLDCNENGIPDRCEISSGAAEDCNDNNILDECEIAPEFDPAAAVARDFCQHAQPVCPGIIYNGDTFDAESEYMDFPAGTIDSMFACDNRVGLYDVWYTYTPAADGLLFVHVEGPGPGLEWIFGLYDDCPCGEETLLECNVFQHHGTIVREVEQGVQYWIRIAATSFNRGAFTMDLVGPDCVLNGNDLNANGLLDDCECPWDVNNDGTVDMDDFLQVVAAMGQPCVGCPEDVEKDGDVDMHDAQSVFLNFGLCPVNVACDNPGTCGAHLICGGADTPNPCFCMERFDGQGGICLQDFNCGATDPCPTGDCPPGYICVVNTCCDAGGTRCAPLNGCEGNPDGPPALAVEGPESTTGLTGAGRFIKE